MGTKVLVLFETNSMLRINYLRKGLLKAVITP